MAYYKMVREHVLIYVDKGRLKVNTFRFSFRGQKDSDLRAVYQGVACETRHSVACVAEDLAAIPSGLSNPTMVLGHGHTITSGLEAHFTTGGVETTVQLVNLKSDQASVLWFVRGDVNGAVLSTDRRSLYGKSLYVSAEPIDTDHPDVIHVPMDPQFDVDDSHFGDKWYTLHEGPGAFVVVMQEE